MIHYIVGDGSSTPLPPHDIQNTVSINEARRLIVNLSMPLADISQLIQDNIFSLDRHQQTLQSHNLSIDEMKKKLHIPVVDLEVTKLSQPTTVCAASKCATMYPVGSLQKWHYKQRCHDPCYLTNVPGETVGAPELRDCAAMDATYKCIKCGCDFSVHMHIYYLTKTKDSTIEDNAIKGSILSREQAAKQIQVFIGKTEARRKEFEKEREKVTKYMAQFAHFLQNNAIIKYNDAYENYIKYMIEREKSLGPFTDMRVIAQLEQLIQQYREARNAFDEALNFCKKNSMTDAVVTADLVKKSIEELYNLPHTGKKIKELVMCQIKAQSNEYKQTEYHHQHHSNIFSEDNDSEGSPNERCSDNRPRTATRGQRYPSSRGQQYRGRGRAACQNFGRNNFDANRHRYPQENPPPYSAQYPYGNQHSSPMQAPHHHTFNQGPQRHYNMHGQPNASHTQHQQHRRPNIEVNISQNMPPSCTLPNCRHPDCAGNQPSGCGNPNCTVPNCRSPYPDWSHQGMSQPPYSYNYPPMNHVGQGAPYSGTYSNYDVHAHQQYGNNTHYQYTPGQNRGGQRGGQAFQKPGGRHNSRPGCKPGNKRSGKESCNSACSGSE